MDDRHPQPARHSDEAEIASDQLHHDPGGVLEFINQDLLKPVLIALQDFLVGFQESIRPVKQVIEVEQSLAPLQEFVAGIDPGKLLVFLFV